MRQFFSVDEGTAPPSSNLVTLAELKTELGITGESEDEALELSIARISRAFSEYCDRLFAMREVVETFAFDQGETILARQPLVLRQHPILAVDGVLVDSVAVDDYEYDASSGRLWRTGGTWSGRVEVYYVGGYDLPDDAPASLQWAVIEAIRQRRSFATADPTIRSTTHGDTAVSYNAEPSAGAAGFSSTIIDAIRPYKRLSV